MNTFRHNWKRFLLIASIGLSSMLVAYANATGGSDEAVLISSSTNQQSAIDDLADIIQDEVVTMHYWLSLATGDASRCESPCARDSELSNIVTGLLTRCLKIEPTSLFNASGFNETRHGPSVRALASACEFLLASRTTLGIPMNSPDWRIATERSRSELAGLTTR